MIKRLLPLSLLLALSASAQTTSVTLQVTDAASQSWNNGSYRVELVNPPGATPGPWVIINTTTPVPNQFQTGALNATGGASLTLTPNASIAPANSVWRFVVATQGSASSFVQSVAIVGASQTVTLTPPVWTVAATQQPPFLNAYSDAEVTGVPGSTYFNVTTGSLRVCLVSPCSSWSGVSVGGTVGTVLTTADISISTGWGSTATKAVVGTPRDFISTWLFTANGTGVAPSPTMTLTFHDGPYTNVPVCSPSMTGGTGSIADWTVSARSGSAYTFVFNTTPVAGSTYEVTVECGNQGFAPGGGSPGGSTTELQKRATATTFGPVTGSSVDSSGNVTLGANLTGSTINKVIYASQQAGANAGASIQTGVNAAVNNGGQVTADFTGSQTITTQLTIPDGVTIRFYPANYTCNISPGSVAPIAGNVVRSANTVTVTVTNSFSAGQFVTLIMANAADASFNGTWVLATVSSSNFTFSQTVPTYLNQTSVGAGNAGLACVIFNTHSHLIGYGTGPTSTNSTIFTAGNNMNAAVIFGQDSTGRAGFMHETSLENIRIEGNSVNNSTGYDLEFHQSGENFWLDRIFASDCKNSCIRPNGRLAGSARYTNLGAFSNSTAFDFWDVGSYAVCIACKGDGGTTFVNLRPASGMGGFNAHFIELKQEGSTGNFIHFDGTNSNTFLSCDFCSGGASGAQTNALLVDGSNGVSIVMTNSNVDTNYTNLITDNSTGEVLTTAASTYAGGLAHWTYGFIPDFHAAAIATTGFTKILVNGANQNVLLGPSPSGNHGLIRITGPTAAFSVGGLEGSSNTLLNWDGYEATVCNGTTQDMTLNNEDAGSIAGNRINTGLGIGVVVSTSTAGNSCAYLKYDGNASRWRIISTFPAVGLSGAPGTFSGFEIDNASNGHAIFKSANPTISGGTFGTSPSVTIANGTAAFRINVGTGGTANSGTVVMPTASSTGWNCHVTDITTPAINETRQSGGSTTTVVVTNYNNAGTATAWPASDILAFVCSGL